ncbi:MAG: ATP-dependent helicase [Oscillospiraceae bacterium]|jgi:DNA helicase-2/ATP-dependent DNA helicase PcrA|nr:ATP-dependent helicase [Oscillospiraceae bacterium]
MTFEEFTGKFGVRLNERQRDAVRATRGPVLLLAVPGSGKTTVIVARIAYMLYCLGIEPGRILTMTYTVAATNEMRARFVSKFGPEYADALEFCTINSLCARIINRYGTTRRREIFDLVNGAPDGGAAGRIYRIYASMYGRQPSEGDVKEIMTHITYCKNMQLGRAEISSVKLEGADFREIYEAYRINLTRDRLMDYDDQLRYAFTVLRKCPDILSELHDRYHYINVDEAQDTSRIQHNIIAMLASGRRNLFMVGDEDQSIYGFRAAYPRALLDFDRAYAPATTLLMEQNYRSTGEIVERANRFIAQNTARYSKRMTTANGWGAPLRRTVVSDVALQYHYLADVAARSDRETAVLYRNNDSALPVIDALDKIGAGYSGGPSDMAFFTNYIVRDIAGIIRFALRPYDLELFLLIYRQLNLRLREDAIVRLRERCGDGRRGRDVIKTLLSDKLLGRTTVSRVVSLRDALGDIRAARGSDTVTAAIETTGYGRYLKSKRADSLRVSVLKSLAELNSGAERFLLRLGELQTLIAGRGGGDGGGKSKFILSTIHSAKGLEFERVIMIDAVQGVLPSVEPPPEGKRLDGRELALLEEERRVFYVGMTRAREYLEFITYENEFGRRVERAFPFVDALTGGGPALTV